MLILCTDSMSRINRGTHSQPNDYASNKIHYLRTIRYSRSTIYITISTYHEKIGQTIENL